MADFGCGNASGGLHLPLLKTLQLVEQMLPSKKK